MKATYLSKLNVRWILVALALGLVGALACTETVEVPGETVVVEKEVVKTVEVQVPGETVTKEVVKTVEVPGETMVVEKEVVKTVEVPGETMVVEKEVVKTVEVPGETVIKEVVKTVEVPGETVIKEVVKTVEKEVVKTVEVSGGPITPTGTISVASPTIGTPGGWPTKCIQCARIVTTSVHETLLRTNTDSRGNDIFSPGLATQWTLADDQSYVDFKLREDVIFQQGWGPMTAEDVAYSWNAGNPLVTPEAVHDTLPHANILKFDPIGKFIVRANMTSFGVQTFQPFSDGWEGIGIFSKRSFDENGAEWVDANVIGTGPFEVEDWVLGRHMITTARPDIENIWDKVPYVETVRYLEVPEAFTRRAMLETNEVQISPIELKDWSDLFARGFVLAPNTNDTVWAVNFQGTYWEDNHAITGEPLTRELYDAPWICAKDDMACDERASKFRFALELALDKQTLVDSLTYGSGYVPTGYDALPSDPIVKKHGSRWAHPFDVAGAKALLAEAGYDTSMVTVEDFWTGPSGFRTELSEAIGAMWEQNLGISVVFDRQPYKTWRPNLVNRTAKGIWLQGWANPLNWDFEQFATSITAPGGYSLGLELPKAAYAATQKNKVATDPAEVERLTVEFRDWMNLEAHHIFGTIGAPSGALYNSDEIKGWTLRRRFHSSGHGMVDDPEWIVPAYK